MSVRLKTFRLRVGDSPRAGMGTDAFYTRASARNNIQLPGAVALKYVRSHKEAQMHLGAA